MQERIVIDPNICHGKPVVRGTRVPASLIVGNVAGGMTFEEIQQEYDLDPEDIRAALCYAGDLASREHLSATSLALGNR